ncbi:MAG TPA: lipid-A-disaccharide synthase [Holophagaceae bacterium]|jgi:lipid-A-disaccharide synthase|nr:lipid-A-disaccharide synthase [Holophagaceae bacterium]
MTTLLVIAGEASGDLHGAELLYALKARRPDLRIIGIGGDRMAPHMDRVLAHVRDIGVVGFIEVLKHLPQLNRLFKQVLVAADEEHADAALFIDYPGFNLRLAKALRKRRPAMQLAQYVCPQVWAWKKGRIPDLGNTLDALYCLFDFEPALFEGFPVQATWVGNPLVEAVKPEVDRASFLAETGLDPSRPLVALLPGSRSSEVTRLLPPMVELVKAWTKQRSEVQWVLPVAPTLEAGFLKRFLGDLPMKLVEDRSYAARAYADAALVASGTATLETALLGTPFAIVYKLNALTAFAAKRLVKLSRVGLANIVAGQEVAPELLQGAVNPHRLSTVLTELLDPAESARRRALLATVRPHLGEPGAADRVAADLITRLP